MAKTASPHPRVVSLIASATEILNALGAGDLQVARSHECDWPPSVLKLPAITRPKFRVEGSSAEIDKAVRALVEHGLAVYDVNADALEKLKPDVILTQDQCEVCAVSLADVERAVCQFVHGHPRIVSMHPHTLADVYSDIARIAEAIGPPRGGQEADRLDAGSPRGHLGQGRRPAEEEARLHRVGRPAHVGWSLDAGADRRSPAASARSARTASHRRGSLGRRLPPPTRT